jgi:hypothetical protein
VRQGREALVRAALIVNPSSHPGQQGWVLLGMGLPVALGLGLGVPAPWNGVAVQAWIAWLWTLTLGSVATEHWMSRGEQRLLRLLPHMPTRRTLGRAWAEQLTAQLSAGTLLHAACAGLAAVWLAPPDQAQAALRDVALVWGVALCWAFWVARAPWATQRAPRSRWLLWATAGALLIGAAGQATVLGAPAALTAALLFAAALLALGLWAARPAPGTTAPWPAGHAQP